jgi:hypothetical protein
MTRLTAVKVKNLKLPGRHGDGGGLYLNIAPGGSKSWIQRVMAEGKRGIWDLAVILVSLWLRCGISHLTTNGRSWKGITRYLPRKPTGPQAKSFPHLLRVFPRFGKRLPSCMT